MRSKNRELVIIKTKDIGILPTYIGLALRHLEKEVPVEKSVGIVTIYTVPVDLLSVGGLIPSDMIDQIEMVELVYNKKGGNL